MSWTHLEDTEPRGRRDYQCDLCGLRIRRGARHVARRGVDSDVGMVTVRMHGVCEHLSRDWEQYEWDFREPGDFQLEYLGLPRVQQYDERRPMLAAR